MYEVANKVGGVDVPEYCEFKGGWQEAGLSLFQCLRPPTIAYKEYGNANGYPRFLCDEHMATCIREAQEYYRKQRTTSQGGGW